MNVFDLQKTKVIKSVFLCQCGELTETLDDAIAHQCRKYWVEEVNLSGPEWAVDELIGTLVSVYRTTKPGERCGLCGREECSH